MAWRLAKSLDKLREQVNEAYPTRKKSSDGTIGDEAHASRTSDHNPWVKSGRLGIVTAIDFTHDPTNGLDAHKLADALVESHDPRIKYVISNKRIASSTQSPWEWRKYTGANPHTRHMHLSVKPEKKYYDNVAPWSVAFPEVKAPSNVPVIVARTTGAVVAGGTAAGQITAELAGPSATTVSSVKEVVDTSGQVVDISAKVIKIVPESIWQQTLAFIQTPLFLSSALGIVVGSWAITWFLRRQKGV